MVVEVSFPRGKSSSGKRKHNKTNNLENDALFKSKTGKSKKKTKKIKLDDDFKTQKILMEPVTMKNFTVGTVILATVCKISDYEVELVTCGGILVTAPIFNISKAYSSAVETFMESGASPPNKPQSMFYLGQTLPVKYMEVQKSKDSGQFDKYIVSLNPADLHEDLVVAGLKPFAPQIILSAAVESVEDHGYLMDVGISGIKGFLSHSEASVLIKKLQAKRLPVGTVCFCAGLSLDARVLKLTTNEARMSKCLITGDDALLPLSVVLPGCKIQARIMEIKDKGLQVVIGNEHNGYVYRDYLASEWDLARVNYKIADVINVTILYVHPISRLISCSLRPIPSTELYNKLHLRIGHKIESAKVVHIDEIGNVILKKDHLKLFAPSRQLADSYIDENKIRQEFPIGSSHDCVVQVVSYLDSLIKVTLRPSMVKVGETIDVEKIKPGAILKGKVVKMTERGLLINIGYRLNVFIKRIHLTDATNISHPEKLFPANKEVKCRILEVDHASDPINIVGTCKKTLLELKSESVLDSIKKATPDFETTGVVVLSNKSGVLLEFFNGLRGFISKVLLVAHANIEESYKLGQLVKCRVISADLTTNRISLALASQDRLDIEKLREISRELAKNQKANNSGKEKKSEAPNNKKQKANEDNANKKSEKISQNQEETSTNEKRKTNSDEVKSVKSKSCDSNHQSSSSSGPGESVKRTKKCQRQIRQLLPRKVSSGLTQETVKVDESTIHNLGQSFLQQMNNLVKGGKKLTEVTANESSEVESETDDVIDESMKHVKGNKLSRVEKSQLIQANEAQLRKKELDLANLSKEPETEEEHERCVIAHPTSSFYWLKYMTYMLSQGDLEKTRAISEKALNSIPHINDDERFNIWVAKMNLEFHFGTEESLKSVSTRALTAMDSLKVYTHLAKMYTENGKIAEATKIYETMLRKFKSNKSVWIEFGMFYYTIKKLELARKLMQRSFDSLAKRDHLDIVSKFAQLEFKLGEVEKGKNLFESLLANQPKRTDIWLIYLSMLMKYSLTSRTSKSSDAVESIRAIFERAIDTISHAKKLNPILVKYLHFEQTYGSSSNASRIKHKLSEISDGSKFTYHPETIESN